MQEGMYEISHEVLMKSNRKKILLVAGCEMSRKSRKNETPDTML